MKTYIKDLHKIRTVETRTFYFKPVQNGSSLTTSDPGTETRGIVTVTVYENNEFV